MVDNLINNILLFSFAIGFTENKVFHLRQILKQPDKNDFIRAIDREMSGYISG